MKFRNTFILLFVAAALGGVVLLLERHGPPPTEPDATPTATQVPEILALDAANVNRIVIEREATSQRVDLVKRQDGLWYLTEPFADEADEDKVTRLLDHFRSLRPRREIASEDVASYGLDNPSLVLTLYTRDESRHALAFGDRNADSSAYYVLIDDGDTVYLVASWIGTDVEQILNAPPAKPTATPDMAPTIPSVVTPTP